MLKIVIITFIFLLSGCTTLHETPPCQWHSYEIYIKKSAEGMSNGEVKIWVDGKELGSSDTFIHYYACMNNGDKGI